MTSSRRRAAVSPPLPTLRNVSDVRTAADRDATAGVVWLVTAHAAIVALPLLVVGLFVLPAVLAVVGALVVAIVVTAVRLRGIGRRVVASLGAVRLGPDERPRLHNVVEGAAMAVGVPVPQLFVVDSPARNALTWADGIGPVSVAFTTGLLDAVDRIELEAVVGRQLTVARDGRLDVVGIAGALFGHLARGPFEEAVASLVHHTVDDRNVVLADLEGARATSYPPGLVAALEQVRVGSSGLAGVPPWLSAFCFAAPAGDEGAFSVHPPIEDRIDLLREI